VCISSRRHTGSCWAPEACAHCWPTNIHGQFARQRMLLSSVCIFTVSNLQLTTPLTPTSHAHVSRNFLTTNLPPTTHRYTSSLHGRLQPEVTGLRHVSKWLLPAAWQHHPWITSCFRR
jgi:hypothetical protein